MTVRLPEATADLVEELAHENRVSVAEIGREAFDFALAHAAERDEQLGAEAADPSLVALDAAPEWAEQRAERDRIKAKNQPNWWRAGFESRVRDQFERAADESPPLHPDGMAAVMDGYREEARALFDDDDRLEEALAFIDSELDAYRSEWRGPETREAGTGALGPSREEAVEICEQMTESHDPQTAFNALSGVYGVRKDVAREVVVETFDSALGDGFTVGKGAQADD